MKKIIVGIALLSFVILISLGVKRQIEVPPAKEAVFDSGEWFHLDNTKNIWIKGKEMTLLSNEEVLAISGEDGKSDDKYRGIMMNFEVENRGREQESPDLYYFRLSWKGSRNAIIRGMVFEKKREQDNLELLSSRTIQPGEKKDLYVAGQYWDQYIPDSLKEEFEKGPHYLTVSYYPTYSRIRYFP